MENVMKRDRLRVAASVWSADLTCLREEIQRIDKYCDSYHFDVMDGHFVPNILFGPDIIKAVRGITDKPFDIHLMMNEPERLLKQVIDSGADMVCFHPEVCETPFELITTAKNSRKKVGIAIKIDKALLDYDAFYPKIDYVNIMGTEIGIKSVDIIDETYERIDQLRKLRDEKNYDFSIQSDGGIRMHTVPRLMASGVNIIVAGSLLFNSNPNEMKHWLRTLENSDELIAV